MTNKSLYAELYSYLEGFEHIEQDEIYMQLINEWSEEQVEDFVINVFKLIPNDWFEQQSYFNFYANSTLAGAPYPCSGLECRIKNVNDLLRFAALYADKILIPSPIDKYFEAIEVGKKVNRINLARDIIIILRLKPIVLAGIIGFVSSYVCVCQECLKKIVTREDELKEKLEKISELINRETSKNISCTLQRDTDGIAYLSINGIEKLGFHEPTDIMIFQENKDIRRLLKKSKEVTVTADMMGKWGIIDYIFAPAIEDVFRVQINTSFSGGSFLTNRPYDAMMISQIQSIGLSKETVEHARMIETGLFHKIPVIGEIEIEKIIRLRQIEGEVFAGYRSKMNAILDKFDTLDRKALIDVQRDIIVPELDAMEQVIHRNKQALIKSVVQDVLLIGGGIGLGVFSGMLPIDYSALVGVVGGMSAISNVADKMRGVFSKDEIKANSFYFLYELQGKYKEK